MRTLTRFILILTGCALAFGVGAGTGSEAQVAGMHHGLFLGFSNLGTNPQSALGQLDPQNRLTTLVSQANGPWPYWGHVWGATMYVDNETVLVHGLIGLTNPPTGYALVAWDPRQNAVNHVLWSGPFNQGTPRNLTNLSINSDGNPVSYDSALGQLVELDRLTGKWNGTRIPTVNNAGLGGFAWDRIRGGYVYANSGSTTAARQELFRTSPDRNTTTTVASTTNATLRGAYGGDLLQNGDWVSGALNNFHYIEVRDTIKQWTTGPASSFRMWDVSAEKFAAPGRGYYAGIVPSPQSVVYVDSTTTPHTVTTIVTSTTAPMPSWLMEVLPLYGLDLVTVRTGKATWDIRINPGDRRFPGQVYAVAASLQSASLTIPVPGGRELFLLPDALTAITARGPFWPFLTGNHGVLDSSGRATARLDLSALGSAANGTLIHFAGVILDPKAPGNIAWVLEPWAFVVDVRG